MWLDCRGLVLLEDHLCERWSVSCEVKAMSVRQLEVEDYILYLKVPLNEGKAL